jgi:uncharacterized RDD family membrane protein YckC
MPPPPPTFGSPPPPPPLGYQPSASMGNYAGFWSRFGAYFIDGLIGFVFSLPGQIIAAAGADAIGLLLQLAGTIAFIVLYCRKVSQGQSWGQKITGVKIVNATTGTSLSAGMVFVRELAKIVSAIVCYLGFLWMLWDKDKQTWHDKMLTTVVVKA